MAPPTDPETLTELPLIGYSPDALAAVLDGARIADPEREGFNGAKVFLLPEGHQLKELPDPHALPPSIRQSVTLDDAASHITYVNRFSAETSVLIADYDAGRIQARLDWHGHNQHDAPLSARHDQHNATFKLLPSEEFTRWNSIADKLQEQTDFALFLEENASDIVDPEPGVMIEISRDLEASQGAKFRSKARLDNGDRTFTYEQDTVVKGDITIPTSFTLEIPLYHGEEPTQLECLFRWRPTPDGLLLGFRWRRVEYARRSHFNAIATRIAEETGLPLFFGRTA
ncbi:DUF2303 family protein [Pelagovum pacificum]|nr:DUF2303 family protein [Pelagovum pacificum]QQA43933.1 DUF2303 family protein [Pelagovum pacificum]